MHQRSLSSPFFTNRIGLVKGEKPHFYFTKKSVINLHSYREAKLEIVALTCVRVRMLGEEVGSRGGHREVQSLGARERVQVQRAGRHAFRPPGAPCAAHHAERRVRTDLVQPTCIHTHCITLLLSRSAASRTSRRPALTVRQWRRGRGRGRCQRLAVPFAGFSRVELWVRGAEVSRPGAGVAAAAPAQVAAVQRGGRERAQQRGERGAAQLERRSKPPAIPCWTARRPRTRASLTRYLDRFSEPFYTLNESSLRCHVKYIDNRYGTSGR